jgi:hypothetical protein
MIKNFIFVVCSVFADISTFHSQSCSSIVIDGRLCGPLMFPIFQDSGGIGVECVETYKKPTTHDPFNVVAFKEMTNFCSLL